MSITDHSMLPDVALYPRMLAVLALDPLISASPVSRAATRTFIDAAIARLDGGQLAIMEAEIRYLEAVRASVVQHAA